MIPPGARRPGTATTAAAPVARPAGLPGHPGRGMVVAPRVATDLGTAAVSDPSGRPVSGGAPTRTPVDRQTVASGMPPSDAVPPAIGRSGRTAARPVSAPRDAVTGRSGGTAVLGWIAGRGRSGARRASGPRVAARPARTVRPPRTDPKGRTAVRPGTGRRAVVSVP